MIHTTYDRAKLFRRARQFNVISKNECYTGISWLIGCISLLLIIILPPFQANAQIKIRENIVSASLLFAAGCSDGVTETLKFHYYDFKGVFPKSSDQFWDPTISWLNKYKNNDPEAGPKYFGSTTVFVGLTDGYHMSRMLRNSFVFGAIAFKIGEPKQKWYYYVVQFIAGGIIYKAGFWTSYELIFRE